MTDNQVADHTENFHDELFVGLLEAANVYIECVVYFSTQTQPQARSTRGNAEMVGTVRLGSLR